MLTDEVFEHVLLADFNYIHNFKNYSTLVGLTFMHTIGALFVAISCLTISLCGKRFDNVLSSIIPYASLFCFSAMHHILISNFNIKPFDHYMKVVNEGFFAILIVFMMRTQF